MFLTSILTIYNKFKIIIINKREPDFLKIELSRECSVSKIKEKMKMIAMELLQAIFISS